MKKVDLPTRRAFGVAVAALISACGAANAQKSDFKDDLNPTGVPDIDQVGDTCAAAAWGNALWYMNQHKPKLGINTAAKPWAPEATKIYDTMNEYYYTKKRGDQAPIIHAFKTNKDDFTPATDKKYPKNQAPFESQWAVQNKFWKAFGKGNGHDLLAEAQATLGTKRIGLLSVYMHDKGKNFDDFKVPLAGNKEGIWSHSMVFSGQDLDKSNALTHLRLSNGWEGPGAKEANVAVKQGYYDKFTAQVSQPGHKGYHPNTLRITDGPGFLTKGGNLAKPEDIDYAQVWAVKELRTDFKTRYAFSYFEGTDSPGDFRGRHAIENFGEGPITQIALELPLLNPKDPSWFGSLQITELPAGWTVSLWDPNTTEYLTPAMDFDAQTSDVSLNYAGLLLTAADGFALNDLDESLILEYIVDPLFLVSTQSVDSLMFAVGDSARDFYAQSLGVPIPAPAAGGVLLLGAALVMRRRRA